MRVFTIKEMGHGVGKNIYSVHLSEKFLQEKMGASKLDADFFRIEEKKKEMVPTDVQCPFCKEGNLFLDKVEPDFSGGLDPLSTKEYVGNKYTYLCSNWDCHAKFFGKTQWHFID